jgi:hypothetical protein
MDLRHPDGGDTVIQCQGTTKKGERCKREAREESAYCAIHMHQEANATRQGRASAEGTAEWDRDALIKAAVGFGLVAAIFLFRFRR